MWYLRLLINVINVSDNQLLNVTKDAFTEVTVPVA